MGLYPAAEQGKISPPCHQLEQTYHVSEMSKGQFYPWQLVILYYVYLVSSFFTEGILEAKDNLPFRMALHLFSFLKKICVHPCIYLLKKKEQLFDS